MKKKILTSLISIISCAAIGFLWAFFLLSIGAVIFTFFAGNAGSAACIIFLLISTFIAVSGIYCIAEREGIRKGFSKKRFFSLVLSCSAYNLLCGV